MRRALTYNEDGELERYISHNRQYFMTPFERRAESLGILREKARERLRERDGESCAWAVDAIIEYKTKTDADVEKAIGDDLEGFRAFQQRTTARIDALFRSGQLIALRCPACCRVTFTPETRQCIWCGHNWRDA
jgi:hypothetical protein